MIKNNISTSINENQFRLSLLAMEIVFSSKHLLNLIKEKSPELYNCPKSVKLDNLCNKWTKTVFGESFKDGGQNNV